MTKNQGNIFTQTAVEQTKRYANTEADQSVGNELVRLTVRLTAEERRQAKIQAATRNLSVNEYIRTIIRDCP